jgi:hypothetical protein
MPLSSDRTNTQPRRGRAARPLALLLCVAGFALTLVVFYPGVMTFDARYLYEDVKAGSHGDWQSPVMVVLWRLVDPVAPGPGSMLLLTSGLYWLAFAILGMAVARRSPGRAVILPLLALMPAAFCLLGMIWRDVLFANVWLLAAVIVYAAAEAGRPARTVAQAIGIGLLAVGVLLRPNALLAAPLLAAYFVWPTAFSCKRAAVLYLPAGLALFVAVQAVYYGALGATRQNPLQSIMVFDLGGITHFTKENQYPVTWTPLQTAMLADRCYRPVEWNIYWTDEICRFVMDRLEADKLFGTPAISAAWRQAVMRHPLAYLQHRLAFFWNFLAAENFSMWTFDIGDPSKTVFADRPAFMAVKGVHDTLLPTPMFRAGVWLLLNLVGFVYALTRRGTSEGAFAIGVCGSAAVYMLTFLVVGVASDFRYAYWPVLAALTALPVVLLAPRSRAP